MEAEQLKSQIQSILFVANRPLSVKDFSKIFAQPAHAVQAALDALRDESQNSGIVFLENNGWYQMATNPVNSTVVKDFLNADLREKLTDATVEVLAIIAYRQPISKAEIEAIRGVNSQYSLRALLMRGLIEKVPNPRDARGFLYETTTEFLQHLGLTSVKELPEFEKLVEHIKLPQTSEIIQEQSSLETPDKTQGENQPPVEETAAGDETEIDDDDEEDDEGVEEPDDEE